jgi:hypothetical protein
LIESSTATAADPGGAGQTTWVIGTGGGGGAVALPVTGGGSYTDMGVTGSTSSRPKRHRTRSPMSLKSSPKSVTSTPRDGPELGLTAVTRGVE